MREGRLKASGKAKVRRRGDKADPPLRLHSHSRHCCFKFYRNLKYLAPPLGTPLIFRAVDCPDRQPASTRLSARRAGLKAGKGLDGTEEGHAREEGGEFRRCRHRGRRAAVGEGSEPFPFPPPHTSQGRERQRGPQEPQPPGRPPLAQPRLAAHPGLRRRTAHASRGLRAREAQRSPPSPHLAGLGRPGAGSSCPRARLPAPRRPARVQWRGAGSRTTTAQPARRRCGAAPGAARSRSAPQDSLVPSLVARPQEPRGAGAAAAPRPLTGLQYGGRR